MKRIHYWMFSILLVMISFSAGAQLLSHEELIKQPVFRSLESALQYPGKVYRLELKGTAVKDSLPEELFRLSDLQELSIRKCRLQKLNSSVGRLTRLQYLNLENNRLVDLPEALCSLSELHTLVINRNMIACLPVNIGRLGKLERIDAWGNPMYLFPDGITLLSDVLITVDLRQVGLRKDEIEQMERQLPKTEILYTQICDCKNGRR